MSPSKRRLCVLVESDADTMDLFILDTQVRLFGVQNTQVLIFSSAPAAGKPELRLFAVRETLRGVSAL